MEDKVKKYCAYYRVSTKKQDKEMASQVTAVKNYLKDKYPPSRSFKEVESGGKDNRPELKKALEYCKKNNAILVVAKLDRLSRSLSFIATLQDNKSIDFVCCDMPQATRETIGFMGVIADWEKRKIGERTREALAEKKKQGVLLGDNNPKVKAGRIAYQKRVALEKAKKQKKVKKTKVKKPVIKKKTQREIADAKVIQTIKLLREENFSYQKIADSLNKNNIPTRQNGKWYQSSVIRIYNRCS